jgi:CheY-like chemotaxis protein
MKVLVIEDDEALRDILTILMKSVGLSVIAVASGDEAIAVWKDSEVSLAVCDFNLGGHQGPELIERLFEVRPHARFLLISGSSLEEVTLRMPLPTHVSFLQKPFTSKQLFAALKALQGIS